MSLDYVARQSPDVFKPLIDGALLRIAEKAGAEETTRAALAGLDPYSQPRGWDYLVQALAVIREALLTETVERSLEGEWFLAFLRGRVGEDLEEPLDLACYPDAAKSCLKQREVVARVDSDVVALWSRKDGRVSVCHAHPEAFQVLGEDASDFVERAALKAGGVESPPIPVVEDRPVKKRMSKATKPANQGALVEAILKKIRKVKEWKRLEEALCLLGDPKPSTYQNKPREEIDWDEIQRASREARCAWWRLIAQGLLRVAPSEEALAAWIYQQGLFADALERGEIPLDELLTYLKGVDDHFSWALGTPTFSTIRRYARRKDAYETAVPLFERALPELPPYLRCAVAAELSLAGRDVPRPERMRDWLLRQFESSWPEPEVSKGSSWTILKPFDHHDALVLFDHTTNKRSPDYERFIQIFVPLDAWRQVEPEWVHAGLPYRGAPKP